MKDKMTEGFEEYLEALFNLDEEGERVHTKDLADRLGLKAASVTEMVKKLAAEKLVEYAPYKGVSLTAKGRKAAAVLVRRHRLSERFLSDMLGVPWKDLHDEACKFEHVISEQVEEKLVEALGNPATCPHGNPIPEADGTMAEAKAEKMSSLASGARGKIVKITEESPDFLQYLGQLGLMPDARVEIEEIAPFGGPIVVKTKGASYALGRSVADHIYIERA
jgi:DtxR family Mn-dependent transcriptional regulator